MKSNAYSAFTYKRKKPMYSHALSPGNSFATQLNSKFVSSPENNPRSDTNFSNSGSGSRTLLKLCPTEAHPLPVETYTVESSDSEEQDIKLMKFPLQKKEINPPQPISNNSKTYKNPIH